MNLYSLLSLRAANGRPVRVGLIGAGKFGSMVLAQAQRIAGLHMVAIADLDVGKAKESLGRVGWPKERYAATSCGEAIKTGGTFVTDDVKALFECGEIECIIEATGHPIAGTRHALGAIESRKHVVMVNVEADVMVGPILAEKARAAGVIYSMAYGDQPALICELVDWARATGFEITAAGKGMNFEPRYRYSTPDTVWGCLAGPRNRSPQTTSTRSSTIPSPTAPKRRSKWPPSQTVRASIAPMMALPSRRPVFTT